MPDSGPRHGVRERFLSVDVSNVADVLDELGLPDQGLHPSFAPLTGPPGKLAGWAFTISGRMLSSRPRGGDPEKMAACAQLTPGSVAVWGGAAAGVALFGELIAIGMKERGCVGALVDGGARDLASLTRLDFPVYARYRSPIQSIGRWKVTAWGVSVSLPGATASDVEVRPGDFILADVDGALVVPAAAVEEVLERAEAIGAREREIRGELSSGLSLADALAKYGHV
jgi:4-hydroxy-4-methyl-2-oxoglutarate aldolase